MCFVTLFKTITKTHFFILRKHLLFGKFIYEMLTGKYFSQINILHKSQNFYFQFLNLVIYIMRIVIIKIIDKTVFW